MWVEREIYNRHLRVYPLMIIYNHYILTDVCVEWMGLKKGFPSLREANYALLDSLPHTTVALLVTVMMEWAQLVSAEKNVRRMWLVECCPGKLSHWSLASFLDCHIAWCTFLRYYCSVAHLKSQDILQNDQIICVSVVLKLRVIWNLQQSTNKDVI